MELFLRLNKEKLNNSKNNDLNDSAKKNEAFNKTAEIKTQLNIRDESIEKDVLDDFC